MSKPRAEHEYTADVGFFKASLLRDARTTDDRQANTALFPEGVFGQLPDAATSALIAERIARCST